MLSKLSRITWYLGDVRLPKRQAPAYLNFCIHSERLYDEGIFSSVLRFSRDFYDLTGKKITVCLSTPVSALVRDPIARNGSSPDVFAARAREISDFAMIGYHGHFYSGSGDGSAQISGSNYDARVVADQIDHEMEWFKSAGFNPKTYVAGWWFLDSDIVLQLERRGIEVDASVRRDKPDTFGGRYLDETKAPQYGRPFILPPSSNIVEIQSIFGPVMPPRPMKGHLSGYISRYADEELFFIFPLHDWDIGRYYRNLLLNVRELCAFRETVRWMDIPDMRKRYLEKGKA